MAAQKKINTHFNAKAEGNPFKILALMEGRNEAKLEERRAAGSEIGVFKDKPGFKSIMYNKQKQIYEKYEEIQAENDKQRESENVHRKVTTLYSLDYRDVATK